MDDDEKSTIPKFVLEKMLLPGCALIPIDEDGFTLKVVNAIAPFKIVRKTNGDYKDIVSFKLDGRELEHDKFYLKYQGVTAPLNDLTKLHGVIVNIDDTVELIYKGEKIEPGKHKVDIHAKSTNPIRIKFEIAFQEGFL